MEYYRPANSIFPPVIKNLVIINVLCWLATIALQKYGIDIVGYLGLHYWKSEDFNVVQLVTYMFLHDTTSIGHIFFNMFGLWMFGKDIENFWGGKKFLIYYFVTGIGAGVIQQITWAIDIYPVVTAINQVLAGGDIRALAPYLQSMPTGHVSAADLLQLKELVYDARVTIGASGAIFGVLLAFAMLFPDARIFLLFIPIPIRAPYFVAFYALCELFMGVQDFHGDNVAHFAHLGGMIFGLILILYWKKKKNINGSSSYY